MKRQRRKNLIVRDVLTEEEKTTRLQDMVLKRAAEIEIERKEKAKLTRLARKKLLGAIERTHLPKRCRQCGAMKYYLANEKTKKCR